MSIQIKSFCIETFKISFLSPFCKGSDRLLKKISSRMPPFYHLKDKKKRQEGLCIHVIWTQIKHFRFCYQNLRICRHFKVYNAIYNGKNLWKPKIFILGTKTHSYELTFHLNYSNLFYKKNQFLKKKLVNLRSKIFVVTMELHYNCKNLKSKTY